MDLEALGFDVSAKCCRAFSDVTDWSAQKAIKGKHFRMRSSSSFVRRKRRPTIAR